MDFRQLDPSRRALSLLDEFKAFAFKGNVIDLAVGVIIGAAFSKIVDSLVKCEPTDHRRALRVTMPPTYRRDKGRPGPTLVSWRSGDCSAASQGQASRPQASPACPAR